MQSDIPFDEKIFKKIPLSTQYKPEEIQMKVLILERLPYGTLSSWLAKNGVKVINEEEAENNVPKDKLVVIYKQLFKIIYELLDNLIFPYDIENLSNYLINPKTLEIVLIDPAEYNIILDCKSNTSQKSNTNHKINTKKLFKSFINYSCIETNRTTIDKALFKLLSKHKDYKEILKLTVADYIDPDLLYDITNRSTLYRIEHNIIKGILGHNNLRICNIRELYNAYFYDHTKYQKIQKQATNWLMSTNYYDDDKLSEIRYNDEELKKLFQALGSQNKLIKEYIIAKLYKQDCKSQTFNLSWVISQRNNHEELTLYYDPKFPLIGYKEHKQGYKTIRTQNYIHLVPFGSDLPWIARYMSDNKYLTNNTSNSTFDSISNNISNNTSNKQYDNYWFNAASKTSIQFLPDQYLIYPYENTEDYLLNWAGNEDEHHFSTYAGLRLMTLEHDKFKEVLNDAKNLEFDEYKEKYKQPTLLRRSSMSILGCVKRDIDLYEQFDSILGYINKHEQTYKMLYRGERRYTKTDFSKPFDYPNIHIFSDSLTVATDFMSNMYQGYDETIVEYIIFTLHNGLVAKINVPIINTDGCKNWEEFLHKPTKYKVTKHEVKKMTFIYPNDNSKHTLTINFVNIIEVSELPNTPDIQLQNAGNKLLSQKNMSIQIDYEYKSKDQINIVGQDIQMRNYQLYAQRYFQQYSNKLNIFAMLALPGTGKTVLSLKMLNDKYQCVIIGNNASHQSFMDTIKQLNFNENLYQYLSYQKFADIPRGNLESYFQGYCLIVDEVQTLFSQDGLNSYGRQLQNICSSMLGDMKIICLSGTMLNTQWYEIFFIANIIEGYDKYNVEEIIQKSQSEQQQVLNNCLEKLYPHFISYTKISNPEDYPTVYFVQQETNGSRTLVLKDNLENQQQFPLYLSLSNSSQNQQQQQEQQDGNNQNIIQIQTYNILPKYYFNPDYQPASDEIVKNMDDIMTYSPLSRSLVDQLEDLFSLGSYQLNNQQSSELDTLKIPPNKIAMYDINVNNQWGLLQWQQILMNLNIIQYGTIPSQNTRCAICYKPLKEHSKADIPDETKSGGLRNNYLDSNNPNGSSNGNNLNNNLENNNSNNNSEHSSLNGNNPNSNSENNTSKITNPTGKGKQSHKFQPLTFCLYYADLDNTQRYELIKMFNSSENINGEICKIILLSSIAETGLTLKAVTDYFILDNIPNYSDYEQIIARSIRMFSHKELPQEQQIVRIYNLCTTNQQHSTNNYYQWQIMFESGKKLKEVLQKISNRQEKVDQQIFQNKLFNSANLEIIINYLRSQNLNQYILKSDLKKIILNPDLMQINFTIKSISDEALDFIYRNLFISQLTKKYHIRDIISRSGLGERIMYKHQQKLYGTSVLNLIQNINTLSTNQIKLFIKQYTEQFVIQLNKFIFGFDTIFSAYFIFMGFVYMQGDDDEEKFIEQHTNLWEFIWDKPLNYIFQNQSKIIKQFNILGIYYGNQAIYTKDGEEKLTLKIKSNFSNFNFLTIYLTTDLPTYIQNNKDFYVYNGKQILNDKQPPKVNQSNQYSKQIMEQQHGGFDMNRQMAYVSNLVGDKAMRVIAWVLVIVAVISLVYIVIGLFNKTKSFKEFGTWIDIGMTGVMFVAGCALITKIPKQ